MALILHRGDAWSRVHRDAVDVIAAALRVPGRLVGCALGIRYRVGRELLRQRHQLLGLLSGRSVLLLLRLVYLAQGRLCVVLAELWRPDYYLLWPFLRVTFLEYLLLQSGRNLHRHLLLPAAHGEARAPVGLAVDRQVDILVLVGEVIGQHGCRWLFFHDLLLFLSRKFDLEHGLLLLQEGHLRLALSQVEYQRFVLCLALAKLLLEPVNLVHVLPDLPHVDILSVRTVFEEAGEAIALRLVWVQLGREARLELAGSEVARRLVLQ